MQITGKPQKQEDQIRVFQKHLKNKNINTQTNLYEYDEKWEEKSIDNDNDWNCLRSEMHK